MKSKKISLIIFVIVVVLITITSCKKQFRPDPRLSLMVREQNYSELYTALTANTGESDRSQNVFYEIILKSVMNRPEESNQLIAEFRNKFSKADDTTEYYLTQSAYDNYVKLCDYRRLKETGKILIDRFEKFIDPKDYQELKDDNVRYTFLENEMPVVLVKKADTKLKVVRDMAGYTMLPVKAQNDSLVNFIFDTGANVSVVTESTARKLGIRFLPGSKIYVMGATGVRNESRIGIADMLTIGNIEIRNAEVVVFADSLFTFAGGVYKINGVVGFPIFSRFEEVQFSDTAVFIPRNPVLSGGEPNMFIKSDDYILAIGYKGKKYPFFFDTGNDKTYFRKNFYEADSATLSLAKDTVFTFSGVGGTLSLKAKMPDKITISCAGKDFQIDKPFVELEADPISKELYGSIGKDFINCYKTRIMSFRAARFEFK
jgi:hypothetical protein